ncbi:MAG: nucleoside-diphosphate kinase [Candidatus Ryanbacteria bacterium RIFCSPHIGHO2_02_FULL_45_13b]|uniref:Nucleoside diphosphate kinase n=1 Tax=Candidatus Ryanbacteria bacterium RIFCSPHIGHO2_02_FULL_45_13b TaxID=1802117 RepID=A0A1G2GAI4_9BACT|nr:MAG: nucleoside-diphosphate kinase [Candidatus Ryanbacteria bacterium RIFCSPHIGHO2_02_FULL_45_13b]
MAKKKQTRTRSQRPETIEQTLVVIKPDGVQRGLMGEIIQRFEKAGLKIIGMRMRWVDETQAKKHYTEDLAQRRGQHVRDLMVDFLRSGPVVAFVVEGVDAIDNVRKMIGSTEPKAAQPGTIRGDYAHVAFRHADSQKKAVGNLIHASSDAADARNEILVWFNEDELFDYKTVHDAFTL